MIQLYKPVPLYSEEDLAATVKAVEAKFADEIEHIRYSVHKDSTDDPAIYFRVLLKDTPDTNIRVGKFDYERLKPFFALTNRISAELRNDVRDWGLPVYRSFRLASEQRELKDPAWD